MDQSGKPYQEKDWRKYVTLNPPNAVIFKENKEEGKTTSSIEIINKSNDHIIFKVKTTEPNNYIVRPNQGSITPESSISVKVICQVNIIANPMQILNDKFLVQLSKSSANTSDITNDEVGNIWKKIPKENIVQYKLKVDAPGQRSNTIMQGSAPAGEGFTSEFGNPQTRNNTLTYGAKSEYASTNHAADR